MTKPTAYLENPNAPALDLDISYTLNQFCKIVSDRHNIPLYTLKRLLSRDAEIYENDGILIDHETKTRRIYIQPQFSRYFVYQLLPKLRDGYPLQMIFKK